MWELVSFALSIVVFIAIMHYFYEPKKIFEDIGRLKGNDQRIKSLEEEIKKLREIVDSLEKSS